MQWVLTCRGAVCPKGKRHWKYSFASDERLHDPELFLGLLLQRFGLWQRFLLYILSTAVWYQLRGLAVILSTQQTPIHTSIQSISLYFLYCRTSNFDTMNNMSREWYKKFDMHDIYFPACKSYKMLNGHIIIKNTLHSQESKTIWERLSRMSL